MLDRGQTGERREGQRMEGIRLVDSTRESTLEGEDGEREEMMVPG
ncbi:predicted protein [Histoplasma capsulatum var. duboisii H88]|uniref:Predicted protein n=2 Tax=Ajellomyces capsulatus TaxID=5037 RepID=F0UHR6_AJEC8|nr:predicted protein [Histoplasma capsulatum H143]EGC46275.1 predicted protein [Histoplasma capsulatum var. duboisii H88]